MLENKNYTNMQTVAYELIRQKILVAEYLPGQKVTEQLIVGDINLGRTPVREALIHLKKDNLINVLPQNGTYIAKIDLKSAQNARFVRAQLERELAAEAITNDKDHLAQDLYIELEQQKNCEAEHNIIEFLNADDEFHRALYRYAGREEVWDWLLTVNFQLARFRFLRLSITNLKWNNIINQHRKMVNLVQQGDIEAVIKLIEQHLNLMLEEQKTVIASFPDYFAEL